MATTAPPRPRAAIYARTATTGQEGEPGALAAQEARCAALVAACGWATAAVHCDIGSGLDPGLPGRGDLVAAVRDGRVDVLVCDAPDRLARDPAHLAAIARGCERHGVRLAFASGDAPLSSLRSLLSRGGLR